MRFLLFGEGTHLILGKSCVPSLSFMNKKQQQAAGYIQKLLQARRIEFESGILDVYEQPCIVIEKDKKCIAIDPTSGVWTGKEGKWSRIEPTCTVSGALQAIEFLTDS